LESGIERLESELKNSRQESSELGTKIADLTKQFANAETKIVKITGDFKENQATIKNLE
jgi:septal ring factor EnvC (AmiA/AmiB activator)